MLELVIAGGWLMVPILLCSVISVTIVLERLIALRSSRIVPRSLVNSLWKLHMEGKLTNQHIEQLTKSSALGRILAAGLANIEYEREIMKEVIEEAGRQAVADLERYLNTLGTIAAISPLLGLLGTVIGMIKVFSAITLHGVGDPTILSGGISEALITTATGLTVAIPSLIFYRYLRGKVDKLTLRMEEEALRLVEMIHGERRGQL